MTKKMYVGVELRGSLISEVYISENPEKINKRYFEWLIEHIDNKDIVERMRNECNEQMDQQLNTSSIEIEIKREDICKELAEEMQKDDIDSVDGDEFYIYEKEVIE